MEMCLLAASTTSTSDYLALCHSFPSFFLQSRQCKWPKLGVIIVTEISIKPGIQAKFTLYKHINDAFKCH
jgi:hypothetical protein